MEWNENMTTNNESELSFLSFYEIRKAEGEFNFSFTNVTFNGNAGMNKDSEVVTLIDGETDTAVSFYCTPHPDGLNQDPAKTDGKKVCNALERTFRDETCNSWADVYAKASANGGLLWLPVLVETDPLQYVLNKLWRYLKCLHLVLRLFLTMMNKHHQRLQSQLCDQYQQW